MVEPRSNTPFTELSEKEKYSIFTAAAFELVSEPLDAGDATPEFRVRLARSACDLVQRQKFWLSVSARSFRISLDAFELLSFLSLDLTRLSSILYRLRRGRHKIAK